MGILAVDRIFLLLCLKRKKGGLLFSCYYIFEKLKFWLLKFNSSRTFGSSYPKGSERWLEESLCFFLELDIFLWFELEWASREAFGSG